MDAIARISETRRSVAEVFADVVAHINGKTEAELRDDVLSKLAARSKLFPNGWYDPPHGGVAVLFDAAPYKRLQFETLRNPASFPGDSKFTTESVGILYASPVERELGMFGDIGFSIYVGDDERIREHLRVSLQMILDIADHAEVGMRFCDLYSFARENFKHKGQKMIGWMTTTHDPLKVNLGHTTPGSYSDGSVLADTFEKTREAIRNRRLYINEVERFTIPLTCAFTVEARLTDIDAELPNAFYHVIVTFSEGKKQVLTNFDGIFKAAGMTYML